MDLPIKETQLIDIGPTPMDLIPGFEDVTIGETIAAPAKGVKLVAKFTGEQFEDIYGRVSEATGVSFVGIPVEKRLEYAQLEEDLRTGEITRTEFTKQAEELKTKVEPEAFGKGVETVVGIGGYVGASLVPGGLPGLLASEVESARQDFQNASELARKEAEKSYEEYLKQPLEEGFEYATEEEFIAEVTPQFEAEIKNQALMAMGMSAGFLIGGATLKLGGKLMKYVPRKKFTFAGRKLSKVKYDKQIKLIQESKVKVAKQELDVFKIRGERELLVPKTESLFMGKGISREVVGKASKVEVASFADDLFKNFKVFKTREEAVKFVEGMSKIKTKSAAGFPTKLDLRVGTLGDISKTVRLPKVGKEWITRGESYSLSSSLKIKGVDKVVTFNYQLGSQGRPINLGLQITTIPKNSRYGRLLFFKSGKKGAYNLVDDLVVDVGPMKTIKVGEDIFRTYKPNFRRIKFDKKRLLPDEFGAYISRVPTKTKLKTLFEAGKKADRQTVIEKLTKAGFEIRVGGRIIDRGVAARVTFARKYDIKILGVGEKQAELFKIPKVLEGPPKVIPKTPFAKTFGVDKGVSPLTLKQVQVLDLPPPSLIIVPKIKPPIVKVAKVIAPPSPRELPYMVGGLGLKEIPYAGKGLYEVTEPSPSFVALPGKILPLYEAPPSVISKDMFEPLSITKEAIIEPTKVIVKPSVFLGMKPEVRVEEVLKLKPITKTIVTPVLAPVLLPKVRELVKIAQFPVLRPRLIERLKVAQILITPTIAVPSFVQRPRLEIPRPIPKKPIIKIPKLEVPSMVRRPPRKKPVPRVGYGFEIKRRGKWERAKIPYAFATKEGAHAVAMERVLKEAAASYRLVKSKKPVKRTRKKPTPIQKIMFRPGKEAGVKVQKKLLRITSPGEVREISLAGAAARRGVSTWGLKKPIKAKRKAVKKKSKSKNKKKKGR